MSFSAKVYGIGNTHQRCWKLSMCLLLARDVFAGLPKAWVAPLPCLIVQSTIYLFLREFSCGYNQGQWKIYL